MSLKILGGTFRSRTLKTPKGPQTRPSLAILRKAVFDISQDEVDGAHVLDLFAGSGAMGLEALSRGAAHATFVDKDRYALECIRENIKTLKLEEQTDVVPMDAITALKNLSKKGARFDFVAIDPPYALAKTLLPGILSSLVSLSLLKKGALIFVEEGVPATLEPPFAISLGLAVISSRTFSQSTLHQLRLQN
jgi:16S rRNA (guanine(966)-N(2))-methyltransferase RsmD